MRKLRTDQEGKTIALMALAFFAAVLLLILAITGGLISFQLPSTSVTDKYSETVVRRSSDVGLLVPIRVTIKGTQEAGSNHADLQISIKPHHESLGSDDNYVPTPTVISDSEFDTKVGKKGSGATYAVNGNSFSNTNATLFNITLVSKGGIAVGNSQTNYMAWETPSSPTPSLSKSNTGIFLRAYWEHKRKGTNEVIESGDVKLLWYVDIPDYDQDNWAWSKTYTANFYVPFTDYAVIEDIEWQVIGYFLDCDIDWVDVKAVKHTWWDFPALSDIFGSDLELAWVEEVTIPTRIIYDFDDPISYSITNSKNPWSHSYTYKIR